MSMSRHERRTARSHEWLTPPTILKALGRFDLDPCAPVTRPWPTARRHYTIEDDGLSKKWKGRVWMNPPYGYGAVSGRWLQKLSEHGDGIALVFARTETMMFHEHVWPQADAILFLKGRIHFLLPDGSRPGYSAGAPSVLIAYGMANAHALYHAHSGGLLPGALIRLQSDVRVVIEDKP